MVDKFQVNEWPFLQTHIEYTDYFGVKAEPAEQIAAETARAVSAGRRWQPVSALANGKSIVWHRHSSVKILKKHLTPNNG
jgi:hypothetical protein